MSDTAALRALLSDARDCALAMMENASYIQDELPNVEMRRDLLERTRRLCADMIGTKHDVVSEIFAVDALLEENADRQQVTARLDMLLDWLTEDVRSLHDLVMDLKADAERDVSGALAYVLVMESATNVLEPYRLTMAAAETLRTAES